MLTDKPRNLTELVKMARDILVEQAISLVKMPPKDPFDHGMAAGKWQGAAELLDDIEALIKPAEDNE